MKIDFYVNMRLPSERAHALQAMYSCEALAQAGATVRLILPTRQNRLSAPQGGDVFGWANVRDNFAIEKIPCLDLLESVPDVLKYPAFLVEEATYAFSAATSFAPGAVPYTRDFYVAASLGRAYPRMWRRRGFVEMHRIPDGAFGQKMQLRTISGAAGAVVISDGIRRGLVARGIPDERILVAPSAIRPDLLNRDGKKDAAEIFNRLGIRIDPRGKKLVGYTGHLFEWKGVYDLAGAAKILGDEFLFVIAGGLARDTADFGKYLVHEKVDNVLLTGHVDHETAVEIQRACDVLTLPNRGDVEISSRYTSPLKMFEYMASGTPLVASDLDSLREVLTDERNALLARPGDCRDLAEKIRRLAGDAELAARISRRAQSDVADRTWQRRAEAIVAFVAQRIGDE